LDGWLGRTLRIVLAAMLLAGATAAAAASMPNGGRLISLTAREQPLNAFLQDMFASMDVLASISPNLAGSVNGTFSGPAAKVLRDVARVYNLITYYDGSVMHVSSASDLARRTFAVTPALSERMMREVADLDLTDTRNTLRRSGEGNMVAVGARRFVEQVEELVRAAQGQTAPGNQPPAAADFRVFYLKYAWAHDVTMTIGGRQVVVPGVATIVRSLVDSRVNKPLGRETLLRPTQPSLKGQGLAGQGEKKASADDARGEQVDRLVNALARTAQPEEVAAQQPQAVAPEVNQVRIQADQRLNAVIVRDSADRMPRYEQLIAALDVEPQSLEIEATIIDVNVDRASELGVNWRWNNDGREASFSGSVPTTGSGGAASVVLGSVGQFIARIRALQTEGAARIVSSPQVVTLSNVEALFDNSQTFFVRVAGRNEVDLFNVSAGTQLRVTPHVFRDSAQTRIKLLVNVEDGNISNRQVDQIPVVERSTVNTQALIAEGESLLIGGMIREITTNGVDKVPGLGDVPVIGAAFRNKTSSSTRVERMFLITPRLAGTRTAAAQSTLGAVRAGATPTGPNAPEPAPRVIQTQTPAPAPAPVPGTVQVQAPAAPAPAAPAPAGPAPAQAAAPAPAPRRSVVVDLDALPATTRSIAAALRDDPDNGRVLKPE
ncbi:MAG TPA: type III secretion system outer membrane ring subunit SctC, partial [Burkholderiaceae bacterium]|nr:type III secretion system outer membrane ring subunit SctC [Burkholderiaceae bacterium]